jgi:hypothetical protein
VAAPARCFPGQILGTSRHCFRFSPAGPTEARRYARGSPLRREPQWSHYSSSRYSSSCCSSAARRSPRRPGAPPASGPPPALGEAPKAPSDHTKNKLNLRQSSIGKRVLTVTSERNRGPGCKSELRLRALRPCQSNKVAAHATPDDLYHGRQPALLTRREKINRLSLERSKKVEFNKEPQNRKTRTAEFPRLISPSLTFPIKWTQGPTSIFDIHASLSVIRLLFSSSEPCDNAEP